MSAPLLHHVPGLDSAARLVHQPGEVLSYIWQVFLPRVPGMQERHKQAWPFYDIYVVRGWGAFGWYADEFPAWVYGLIVIASAWVSGLCGVAWWQHRYVLRQLKWEIAVLLVVVAGVVGGVEAAYESPAPRAVVAEQGRYAFTATVPLVVLGIGACFGVRARNRVVVAAIMACAVVTLSVAARALLLSNSYS
jgi:hypothetical protein